MCAVSMRCHSSRWQWTRLVWFVLLGSDLNWSTSEVRSVSVKEKRNVSRRVTVESVHGGSQTIEMRQRGGQRVRYEDVSNIVQQGAIEPHVAPRDGGARPSKHGGLVTERDVLTIARCQPERRLSERAHRRDRWQSIIRPEPAILLGAAPICRACLGVATFEIDFSLAHARHPGSSEKQPC